MSLKKEFLYPTAEEINLLRKKLNSIVDIPLDQQNTNYSMNDNYSNNYDNTNNNNKNYYYNDEENKKNEIINQQRQKIAELENIISSNYDKNKDSYFIQKSNSPKDLFQELYSKINNLLQENSKLKKDLYLSSKQNENNKELLSNYIEQSLTNNKKNINRNLIDFLLDRVEKLEYQNFFLASKIENYSIILNQYIDELCEYIDIIEDLQTVINDISENINNNNILLNDDFYLVKDTLNNKKNILKAKYNSYLEFRNKLNTDDLIKNNDVFLMTGNKINDMKNINNKSNVDFANILDEKIKKYELLSKNEIDKNQNLCEKEIFINNMILEQKNSELRQILKDILANDIYSTPVIDKKIKDKLIMILNRDYDSGKISGSMLGFGNAYEDLLMMLNVQCTINEN